MSGNRYTDPKVNPNFENGSYVSVDDSVPSFKHSLGDAGYDLYTTKDTWIFPFFVRKVPLNIKAEIPNFHFGFITSRSGESLKGNVVISGMIDSSYRGQMSAIMYRVGFLPKKIKKGTRVCQMIIVPHKEMRWTQKKSLSNSKRNENGFGSTGNT